MTNSKKKKSKAFMKRLKDNLDFVLQSFPELRSEKIEITFNNVNWYMVAQPVFLSLLQKRPKRTYRIIISRKKSLDNFVEDMNDSIIRGWFSHELSHIISYQKMTNLELVLFGLKYVLNRKFIKQVEIEATEEAIRRGFKKEIFEVAEALFNSPIVLESYKQKVREIYKEHLIN